MTAIRFCKRCDKTFKPDFKRQKICDECKFVKSDLYGKSYKVSDEEREKLYNDVNKK